MNETSDAVCNHKRCNIRVKWRSWLKGHISDYMTVVNVVYTLGMLHFGKQLFTEVCSAKHTHYLLIMADKVGELSGWKSVLFIKINLDFKTSELWRSVSFVSSCYDTALQSTSNGVEKILKFGWRAVQMGLQGHMYPAGYGLENFDLKIKLKKETEVFH